MIQRVPSLQPWFFPWRISSMEQYVDFVEVSRDSFNKYTFHDQVHLGGRVSVQRRMTFSEVSEYCSGALDVLFPPRYIFHHAFCCSTLLARYLECPGITFAYREPAGLTELALIDAYDRGFLATKTGGALLQSIAKLHRRTEFATEKALVKACDLVTGIAEHLISLDPETRTVLIYSDLESFVLACLKSESRCDWMKNRASLVQTWTALDPTPTPISQLSDGAAAAWLWGSQMSMFKKLVARFPDRILALSCEDLLVSPSTCLSEVAQFFGISYDSRKKQIGTAEVHAKTGAPYNAARREFELNEVRLRYPDQLKLARIWCDSQLIPETGASFLSE